MENLGIDNNTRNTGGGIIQGTDYTLPLFVNSSGELLVEIIPTGTVGAIISPQNLPIDENGRNCARSRMRSFHPSPVSMERHTGCPDHRGSRSSSSCSRVVSITGLLLVDFE